jgi:hypothetical protein
LLITVAGWLWHFPELTYAPGVVIESQRLPSLSTSRITYEYTAFGFRYRGQRIMRLSTQVQPFYKVGSLFPIYFVTKKPETSYGPSRPIVQPLLWIGIFLAAWGGVIIYFAWPR